MENIQFTFTVFQTKDMYIKRNVYLHQNVLPPLWTQVSCAVMMKLVSMLFNHSFITHHILYIVLQIRSCETSICLRVTWPRWPSSQEWAWGLLKHAILCVYQACRTNSFAVQKVSRATDAAARIARSWQSQETPVQLRASWRTDILQDREWQTAVMVAVKWKQVRPVFLQKQMPQ